MSQEIIDTFNIIKENINQNKLVYETDDGMFSCPFVDFAQKTPEELLKLLGIDIDTIFKNADKDSSRFVNDLAIASIICHYRENWSPNIE